MNEPNGIGTQRTNGDASVSGPMLTRNVSSTRRDPMIEEALACISLTSVTVEEALRHGSRCINPGCPSCIRMSAIRKVVTRVTGKSLAELVGMSEEKREKLFLEGFWSILRESKEKAARVRTLEGVLEKKPGEEGEVQRKLADALRRIEEFEARSTIPSLNDDEMAETLRNLEQARSLAEERRIALEEISSKHASLLAEAETQLSTIAGKDALIAELTADNASLLRAAAPAELVDKVAELEAARDQLILDLSGTEDTWVASEEARELAEADAAEARRELEDFRAKATDALGAVDTAEGLNAELIRLSQEYADFRRTAEEAIIAAGEGLRQQLTEAQRARETLQEENTSLSDRMGRAETDYRDARQLIDRHVEQLAEQDALLQQLTARAEEAERHLRQGDEVRAASERLLSGLGSYADTLRGLLTPQTIIPSEAPVVAKTTPSIADELERIEQRISALDPLVDEAWDRASTLSDEVSDTRALRDRERLTAAEGPQEGRSAASLRAEEAEREIERLQREQLLQDQRARTLEARLKELREYRDAIKIANDGANDTWFSDEVIIDESALNVVMATSTASPPDEKVILHPNDALQRLALQHRITPLALLILTLFETLPPGSQSGLRRIMTAASDLGITQRVLHVPEMGPRNMIGWFGDAAQGRTVDGWLTYRGKPAGTASGVYVRNKTTLPWDLNEILTPEERERFPEIFKQAKYEKKK